MGIIFNGGFMKPMNLFPGTISCSVRSDVDHQVKIIDDNTTYLSKLFPTITQVDSTTNLIDPMELRIFWDQTTQAFPGKPTFIESPPDDYHPAPAIEFSENILDLGLKTPHFIVKKDSTSQYYGKDRYDNFLIEPLRNFGNQFTWFNNDRNPHSSFNTFNGGDICSTPNGLHLAFMYLKAEDATMYLADLYHSKYSDIDGTFQNPTLIESNINVAGRAAVGPLVGAGPNPYFINIRSDPKFLYIPNTGLLLGYLAPRYNYSKDSTEYFINLKISKDDGSSWSFFNELKITPFTNEKELTTDPKQLNRSLSLIEQANPQFGMIYAENKIVVHLDFSVDFNPTSTMKSKLNLFYSTDLGKSFKFIKTEFGNIEKTLRPSSALATTMYYDPKISKFFIVNILQIEEPGVTVLNYGVLILANRDSKLDLWDIVYTENLGSQGAQLFTNKTDQPWQLKTSGYKQQNNNVPRMNSFVDENGLCNLIINGSMNYRKSPTTVARAFDDFADYSGDGNKDKWSFISNPLMVPLELNFATDSYLGQFTNSSVPWRARKLSAGNVGHKNNADNGTVSVLSGASISLFQDGITFAYDEIQPKDVVNPDNRFSIHRMVNYKNDRWALGTDTIIGAPQENRNIVYQIPCILNRPSWSNMNFKPRKICYFNPTRYYDSTFRGWVDAGYGKVITGSERYIEYPTPIKSILTDNPLSNSATTVNVVSTSVFPAAPNFILLDSEIIKYTGTTGTSFTGCTRGVSGTIAVEHLKNTIVYVSVKKYWEAKFFRTDNNSGFGSGLAHYNADETQFKGIRGSTWDMDSTRGAACHFICSLDSGFYKDITSMVHMLSVPDVARTQTNKSILSTFLGKDFIGFRSSGSLATNAWATRSIDSTRDIEVIVIVSKNNDFADTHDHRAYVKYKDNYPGAGTLIASNNSDWTFMYYTSLSTGSAFNGNAGVAFGNLLRWPTLLSLDATNVVYFKYHAESWSAYEMHHQTELSGSDNLLAVLPQPCTPVSTHLPNGIQVAWNGQDATANATFKIRQSDFKNSATKILDLRPNIFWRSMDGSATLSIDIDFGKSINFDTVSLYKHNIYGSRFFYGQENNTTDMTAFLYHEQFLPLDSSTFVSFADYETSVVDSDTLLIYSGEFTRYVKTIGDDIIGKSFQFYNDTLNQYFIKKCKYFELLDDASTYIQFENPIGNNYVAGINRNFNTVVFVGAIVQILEDKHMYVLPRSITARYIRMDIENIITPFWGIKSGIFTNYGEVNFDGFFKVGCLSFGTFQFNENPIQNNFKTKYMSPNIIQPKAAGGGVSIQISDVIKKNSFSTEITASEYGRGSQFEQIENFIKDIGVGRDVFYFTPRKLIYPDGQTYPYFMNDVTVRTSHGFNYLATDFYMVKMTGNPSIRRNGNLASLSLQLEEVI